MYSKEKKTVLEGSSPCQVQCGLIHRIQEWKEPKQPSIDTWKKNTTYVQENDVHEGCELGTVTQWLEVEVIVLT